MPHVYGRTQPQALHKGLKISATPVYYEGRSESKERIAIQKYLLIGKKQNMQVLSHTFTYFST